MSPRAKIVRRQRAGDAQVNKPLKIVVTGPFAAGKTTLIESISDIAIVGTERLVTDETSAIKQRTTVAMDFGRLTFAPDLSLFLFGTPGQKRFEVMWEILSEGMIGFIVLVNAADDRSLGEARHILDTFRRYADVPYVVGVTHMDQVERPEQEVVDEVREGLDVPYEIHVRRCDPREKENVKDLMLRILSEVMERLETVSEAVG